MRIQIDGTNTINKGAELMLYAILQEIERRYPAAEVLYNRLGEDSSYIHTNVNFRTRLFAQRVIPLFYKFRIPLILRKLSIPCSFFTTKYVVKNIDIVLDAGGFQFSDQWNYTDYDLLLLRRYYKKLKKQGSKIILLPQAFGPFHTKNGKISAEIIGRYVDIIFAREKVSCDYLINAGVDENKIKLYPDFTALVEGIVPKQYESLQGSVCIIPNMRMIDKGTVSLEQYLSVLCQLIQTIREKGKDVFLLNHEGKNDGLLCKFINNSIQKPLVIANNLTALEVKGIISQSYLLISSRFHGVASALNSGIPCLATSWSHKYEELFKDYGQYDCLLDFNYIEKTLEKVKSYLSKQRRNEISVQLKLMKISVIEKNKEMWNIIDKIIH